MMKSKNFEMKFYEILGVNFFKKFVLSFQDFFGYSKVDDENFVSDYQIGKNINLKRLMKFKKSIIRNVSVNVFSLIACIPGIILFGSSIPVLVSLEVFMLLNVYCIMLQRYNYIRVSHIIKKDENKKKIVIKKEILEKDFSLSKHSYKFVDKKMREFDISLVDLINNASLEQLKKYSEFLTYCKNIDSVACKGKYFPKENEINIIDSQKNLKVKIKR